MNVEWELPRKVMKLFRSRYPFQSSMLNTDLPAIFYEEACYKDRPYVLPLVILKTRTCKWFQTGGGCTMCNFQSISAYDHTISKENIINQVNWAMKKLTSHFQRPYLHLTSSGSFLDPDEIDEETLIEILRIIKKNNVEVLSTESRPEFVLNEQRLETMRENFNGSISIGIGLESSNDFIRNFCINKGFGTKAFMQAVDILKKHDITFHSYILLGKPFLSTYEDIEDTLRTIRLTISLGGIAIVRLVNLQAHTLVHWLWERNMYALPRLWSALRVLEDLTPTERSKVWIKGIDKDMPPAIAYAMNCEECTSTVHNALVGWNITRDYHIIKQIIDCCDCKIGWEKTLEEPSERNEKRILETYETIFDEMQQQSL